MAKYLKCDQCGAFKSMTDGAYELPADGWVTLNIWHAVGPNQRHEFCSVGCALLYLTPQIVPVPPPAPEPQAV